jgi:hypothetical protein
MLAHTAGLHDSRSDPIIDPGTIGVSVSDYGRIDGWEATDEVTIPGGGSPLGIAVNRDDGRVGTLAFATPTTTFTVRTSNTLTTLYSVTLTGQCYGVTHYHGVGWVVANRTDSLLYVYDDALVLVGTIAVADSGLDGPWYLDTFVSSSGAHVLAVADYGNDRIVLFQITPTTLAVTNHTHLDLPAGAGPSGVDCSFRDVVLVCGYTDNRIYTVSHQHPATPILIATYGTTGTGDGEVTGPLAICGDGVGSAWFVNNGGTTPRVISRLQALALDGAITTSVSTVDADNCREVSRSATWRGDALTGTASIALSPGGVLYAANRHTASISGDHACFVARLDNQQSADTDVIVIPPTGQIDRHGLRNYTATRGPDPYPISYTPAVAGNDAGTDRWALIEVAYRHVQIAAAALIEAPASLADLAAAELDPIVGESLAVGTQIRSDTLGTLIADLGEGGVARTTPTLEATTRAPAWQWGHPAGVSSGVVPEDWTPLLGNFRARVRCRGVTAEQWTTPYVYPVLVVVRAAVGDQIRLSSVAAPAVYVTWTCGTAIGAMAPIRLSEPTLILPTDFDTSWLELGSSSEDQVIWEYLSTDTDSLQVATLALFEVPPI